MRPLAVAPAREREDEYLGELRPDRRIEAVARAHRNRIEARTVGCEKIERAIVRSPLHPAVAIGSLPRRT
jgi:hypothetical protein